MASKALTLNDLKAIFDKVLPSFKEFGTRTAIDLTADWTPLSDGIVNVVVGWNNNVSYGYMYIKDYTDNEWVGMISNAGTLGGFSVSTSFPVIKGHTYKVDMSNQVGSITAKFFPLSK